MQLMRVLVGVVIGAVMGVVLTNVILENQAVRVWLINVPSLTVWVAALATGVGAAAASPRRFEVPIAALSVLLGSLGALLYAGSAVGFSLADLGTLATLVGDFLKSGFCLLVFAGIGGWIVAGIRSRIEENKDAGQARAGGQYPQGPYR